MEQLGKKFEKDTGVKVVVEHPDKVIDKFFQATQAGKGPDALYWAHDRLGEMVAGGLVAALDIAPELKSSINEKAWKAFTIGGKVYGYPIGMEAVGLVYNKKLVPTPPKTFEEIFELDKKLKKGEINTLLYDYNNFYFSFGLLAAPGGYVFGEKADGDLNPEDIGLNNAGAIAGLTMLSKLIDQGVMAKGANYSVMDAKMNQGQLGMMINGPWSWKNLSKNKIDFGVAPLPSIGGKPAKPFVGVQGLVVNRTSKNPELIKEFLEKYVLSSEGVKTLDADESLGVSPSKAYYAETSKKANVAATMTNIEQGILMPNIQKMGAVWGALPSAIENVTGGRQSPADALNNAVRRIKGE